MACYTHLATNNRTTRLRLQPTLGDACDSIFLPWSQSEAILVGLKGAGEYGLRCRECVATGQQAHVIVSQ